MATAKSPPPTTRDALRVQRVRECAARPLEPTTTARTSGARKTGGELGDHAHPKCGTGQQGAPDDDERDHGGDPERDQGVKPGLNGRSVDDKGIEEIQAER